MIVARRNTSSAFPLTPSPLLCLFRTFHTYLYRITDLVFFCTLYYTYNEYVQRPRNVWSYPNVYYISHIVTYFTYFRGGGSREGGYEEDTPPRREIDHDIGRLRSTGSGWLYMVRRYKAIAAIDGAAGVANLVKMAL